MSVHTGPRCLCCVPVPTHPLLHIAFSYFHLEKDNLSTLPKPHLIVYVFSCIFTFTVSSPWEVTLCLPHEDRHKPLSFLELLSNWDANPGTSLPSGRSAPRSSVTAGAWSVLVMPGRKVNITWSCTNVCVWFCCVCAPLHLNQRLQEWR